MKGKKREILNRLNSITSIMVIRFSIVALLIILLFLGFSIYNTRKMLIENSTKNSEQLVKQASNSIDGYVDKIEMIMCMLLDDRNVNNFFNSSSDLESFQSNNLIKSILNNNKEVYSVVLINKNRESVVNSGKDELSDYNNFINNEWFQNAIASDDPFFHTSSLHVQNAIKGEYEWVITISKLVKDVNTGETLGLIFVDLKYDVINKLCKGIELGDRGYVYIIDNDKNIIHHPQQRGLLTGIKEELIEDVVSSEENSILSRKEGDEKIYSKYKSNSTKWTTVGVSYVDELIQNENKMYIEYCLLGAILILVEILIVSAAASRITKPVKELKEAMESVKLQNIMQYKVNASGSTEVISLGNSFEKMLARIDYLMKQVLKEQTEKRASEMRVLQSQINPHFLYNTLDSIIWMIEIENNEEAILMTSSLAKLFRQAIGNSNIYTSIKSEIEYTKNYLIIQKMRYRDKIDFDIQIDEDINDLQIIKLVLQPIVENALYHGLKYRESNGLIMILGYRVSNDVIIEVHDNGIGIPKDKLDNIFNLKPEGKSNGVGVKNIQTRLKLTYGNEYGMNIYSSENFGTRVIIRIPCQIFTEGV